MSSLLDVESTPLQIKRNKERKVPLLMLKENLNLLLAGALYYLNSNIHM